MIKIKPSSKNTIIIDNESYYPLQGYEDNYFISKTGLIFSKYQNKILKKGTHPNGYVVYHLWKNKKVKKILAHRLVAENFIGEIKGKVVNHLDLNKQNNCIENLEICTSRENIHHYILSCNKEIGITITKSNTYRLVIYLKNKPIDLGTFENIEEAKEIRQKALILIKENKSFEDIKKIAKKKEHKNYRLKKGKYEICVKGKYLGRFEKEVEAIEFIKNYKNDKD
jgi:hypothetical protein